MAASKDSPMSKDVYDRIGALAEEDAMRTDETGDTKLVLDVHLKSGLTIEGVGFIDGPNSVDDQSIDVAKPLPENREGHSEVMWIVPMESIEAIRVTYPYQDIPK